MMSGDVLLDMVYDYVSMSEFVYQATSDSSIVPQSFYDCRKVALLYSIESRETCISSVMYHYNVGTDEGYVRIEIVDLEEVI